MNIVVLTGAGISAESGLGTFRDAGGLWAKYPLEEVATPEGFSRDPRKVHEFYNARRKNAHEALHNAAHTALAALACKPGIDLTLVTQNIDDLHERAGSPEVVHMHGEITVARCAACGARWGAPLTMAPEAPCPACGARRSRPDVVWFGEMPYHMERIMAALAEADVFAAIGTSGEVYPAAGFVSEARLAGAETVEINLEPTGGPFHRRIVGPATETVPAWVETIVPGSGS